MKVKQALLENVTSGSSLDRIGHKENMAWVIDGADALTVNPILDSPAQWLVDSFNNALTVNREKNLETSLENALNTILSLSIGKKLATLSKVQQGCFTLAIASLNLNQLSLRVIGDAHIVLMKTDNRIFHLTDDRISSFSEQTRMKKTSKERYEQMLFNRSKMNTPSGYWVGSLSKDWPAQMKSFKLPASQCKRILLCSDGFYRAHTFGITDWEDVLAEHKSLKAIFQDLRRFEIRKDINEVKQHDDVSALLLAP